MKKQFWVGLIIGIVLSGVVGIIIGVSMVGKKAVVKPSNLEAFIIDELKNLRIPEQTPPAVPIERSEENLLTGGEHFNHHCAVCHDLEGDADSDFAKAFYPPVADLTSGDVQEYSDGQLKWIVDNGIRFTGMPGWEKIIDSTTQWKIVYYMRALANPEEAQKLEAALKEAGKWKVEAGGEEDHHHAEEEAGESSHMHEETTEHAPMEEETAEHGSMQPEHMDEESGEHQD